MIKGLSSRPCSWTARPTLVALFISVLQFGCGQKTGRNSPYNSSGFDTGKDEAAALDVSDPNSTALKAPLTVTEENAASLQDSLRSEDPGCRKRWASAAILAWHTSDGALSEALSSGALAYPQKHPAEFLAQFASNESDLAAWADLISGELIIADVEPFDTLDQYMDGMRQLCIGCPEKKMVILDHFEDLVRERLVEKLR